MSHLETLQSFNPPFKLPPFYCCHMQYSVKSVTEVHPSSWVHINYRPRGEIWEGKKARCVPPQRSMECSELSYFNCRTEKSTHHKTSSFGEYCGRANTWQNWAVSLPGLSWPLYRTIDSLFQHLGFYLGQHSSGSWHNKAQDYFQEKYN